MSPLALRIVAYPVLKYLAYAGWCSVAPGRAEATGALRATAWGLGGARLLIGVVVGAALTFMGLHTGFGGGPITAWVGLLLPVRWLEWSVTAAFMRRAGAAPRALLLGLDGPLRLWQLGGIVVSFATDLLMLAALGGIRALIC